MHNNKKEAVFKTLDETCQILGEGRSQILNWINVIGYKVKKERGEYFFTGKNIVDLRLIKEVLRSNNNGTLDKARKCFYEKKKIDYALNKLNLQEIIESVNADLSLKIINDRGEQVQNTYYTTCLLNRINLKIREDLIKKFTKDE